MSDETPIPASICDRDKVISLVNELLTTMKTESEKRGINDNEFLSAVFTFTLYITEVCLTYPGFNVEALRQNITVIYNALPPPPASTLH